VIASLDPSSAQTESPQKIELRQLVRELKTTELEPKRRSEILERMQRFIASISVDDNKISPTSSLDTAPTIKSKLYRAIIILIK
jgi:hypothetical protein